MAARKTPVRIRLEQLLADGEWHDRDDLVAALILVMPPGAAARTTQRTRAEKRRQWGNNGGPNPALSHRGDDHTVGARHHIVHMIGAACSRGALQRSDGPGWTVLIRLTPKPRD